MWQSCKETQVVFFDVVDYLTRDGCFAKEGEMTNNKNLMLFFCGILLAISAMTPARAWIRFFNTASWGVTLMVLFQHDKYRRVCPKILLTSGIAYVAVRVFLGILKKGGMFFLFRVFLNSMLLLFIPVAIFIAIVAFLDYWQFRRFVVACILVMLPFLLLTIYMPIGTSRMNIATAMMISDSLVEETEEVSKMGVMMYPQIHSLPFLVVSSIMLMKHLKVFKEKFAFAMLATLLVVAIVRSGFGYAIVATFILVAMSFSGAKRKSTNILVLVLMGIFGLFFIKSGSLASMLNNVQESWGYGNVVGEKAGEVSAIIQGNSSDAADFSGRQELYKLSLNAFIKHPFFGAPSVEGIGGHAYWLDILGQWGLVGFFVEALMFAFAVRLERDILPDFQKYYFNIAFLFYMLICCVKAGGMSVQNTAFFLMFSAMLVFREDDFYFATNKIRRLFNLPPRIPRSRCFRPSDSSDHFYS